MAEATTDEDPTAHDPTALTARMREDGFLVLRGLLPPDPLVELRGEVAQVLGRHGWLADGVPPEELVPDANRRDGSPGWWRMYEDLQRLELLHRLACTPTLVTVMRALTGSSLLNHPRRLLKLVHPGFWIPPHQEFTYVQGTADCFAVWVPLTPFDAAGGSLRVLSERGPRRLRPLARTNTGGVVARHSDEEARHWWSEPLAPGDVVVLHSLTLWGCDQNRSRSLRLAAEFRYQSARLPVCKGSLHPHHYPRLPGWRELTRGWSGRQWVRTPRRLKLARYVLPERLESWHQTLPAPASRFFEVLPSEHE